MNIKTIYILILALIRQYYWVRCLNIVLRCLPRRELAITRSKMNISGSDHKMPGISLSRANGCPNE